jgi:hypothetical protein
LREKGLEEDYDRISGVIGDNRPCSGRVGDGTHGDYFPLGLAKLNNPNS